MTRVHADDCLDADDVAALWHDRLDQASQHAMERHVAGCAACRELLSALVKQAPPGGDRAHDEAALGPVDEAADDLGLAATQPRAEPTIELVSGDRVGRYVIVRKLGAGAMGAVYAAHDLELDRKVALKILHDSGRARGERERVRDRLRREAQAMAQLAHPNVVAVHDVGTVDDHIFIAMELVQGETLAAWLAVPRPWRAVLAMFLAAGQGLVAAHTAGLVHRDFKPENVLVGHDGRVRVGDFGLAWMPAHDEPAGAEAPGALVVRAAGSGQLTARSDGSTIGVLAGTPYYMAPEQLLCRPTDERSDQFSFCVALYAALAHAHPFGGGDGDGDVERLAGAVLDGRMQPAPPRRILPRHVLRVLQRGLATAPEARHASMAALLAALADDPRRRAMRVALVAGGALVIAGGVALAARDAGRASLLCSGADSQWAGVWDASRAQAVASRFAATGKPYAGAVYATVAHQLGAYRTGWTTMHTEACQATRVRGEQSEDLLGRRMLCLDARLRDARALVDRLAVANSDAVEHAPVALLALGDLASCANTQALSSQVPPPADKVTQARVTELRAEIAERKAERIAGRAREGRAQIAALVSAAAATRYRPLEAEALWEQGATETSAGDLAVAARAFEQAVWAAEAGRDDELAARAWTELMQVRGTQAQYDQGLAIAPRVTAVLERLGGHDEIEGSLHIARAAILSATQRFAEAQTEAEQALALFEHRFGPDDLHVAAALDELATIATLAGRHDDAIAHYTRELAIHQRVYGDHHPAVAAVLSSLAVEQTMKSRYQESLVTLGKAQAIWERTVDPNHRALAKLAYDFGLSYGALGQFDKAVEMYRRAVAIGAIAYGTDHPNYASFLMGLGHTLDGLGRYDEALPTLRQAAALLEARLGPAHIRLGRCLSYLAGVLVAQGKHDEARATMLRVVSIYEQALGGDNPELRQPLIGLGMVELRLGAAARALGPLERAYAFGTHTDPGVDAELRWALGRALFESGRDRARGMRLIAAAQVAFEADPRTSEMLRELVAWRRRRG